jgi:hypothetical protein
MYEASLLLEKLKVKYLKHRTEDVRMEGDVAKDIKILISVEPVTACNTNSLTKEVTRNTL